MIEYRSLLLRSNRFLGSALVERNFISLEDLDAANQKLLEVIQKGNLKQASILNILLYEMRVIDESSLINQIVENSEVGLVDLGHYDILGSFDSTIDLPLCWATWTLPFDKVDDINFVATTYYLSAPVIKHWREVLSGHIIWYTTSVGSISEALEALQSQFDDAEGEGATASTGTRSPVPQK